MGRLIAGLVCLALFMPPFAYAAECGYVEFIKDFEKNNDVEHRGYYFQPNHCFSVTIPKGITGRTSSDGGSQHGFGSVISHENGGSYLLVQGDYGAWLDDPDDETPRSLKKVIRYRLSWLKKDKAKIIRRARRKTRLGPLPAIRSTVSYKCPQSPFTFIEDSVLAFDSSRSVYEVTLYTTDKNHRNGSKVLEEVARSWKLETTKCNEH
jgi:hypothetical protein